MPISLAEQLAVVSVIDPDAYAAGSQSGDIIDMQNREQVMFIVCVGDMVSDATADFVVEVSAASNMANPTILETKRITQLTQAGSDDNKQAVVVVRADEVAQEGARYVRGTLILTTAGADAAVVTVAGNIAYHPASEADLASVDEIIA